MSNVPELRIGNTVYTFQDNLRVWAWQRLQDILHEARLKLYAKALKMDEAGRATVDGLEVTKQFYDIQHELARADRYAEFIACCVVESERELKNVEMAIKELDFSVTLPIYDFFFSSGTILSLLFPGFSFTVNDQASEIQPTSLSTNSPTANPGPSKTSE